MWYYDSNIVSGLKMDGQVDIKNAFGWSSRSHVVIEINCGTQLPWILDLLDTMHGPSKTTIYIDYKCYLKVRF